MSEIKRTERGWPGHYIMGYACLFRRNTLLEYGDKKYIVSTIGNKFKDLSQHDTTDFDYIGYNRYFETMTFKAKENRGYIDIDVSEELYDYSDALFAETYKELITKYPLVDNVANDMHENMVDKVIRALESGVLEA